MLDRAVKRDGSISAVARKLRISRSRISDALHRRGRPLGVDACLQLAIEYGEDHAAVLRANGKEKTADLLDALGVQRPSGPPSPARRRLERRLDHLSEEDLDLLASVAMRLASYRQRSKRTP
jgi:hypothetical protein